MICVEDLLSSAASACVFASHQLCEGLLRMLSCANVALSLSTSSAAIVGLYNVWRIGMRKNAKEEARDMRKLVERIRSCAR